MSGKFKKKKKYKKKSVVSRYPVITLVLYFGYKNRWNKPDSLIKRLTIPPELEPYVNDYKINVFEIAYMTEDAFKVQVEKQEKRRNVSCI